MGDEPTDHAVHVDIYVSGRRYGGVEKDPHVPKDIEVVITLDESGETPIGDPSKDKLAYVFEQRVPEMHDGFCEGMRYKTALARTREGYAVPFTQGFASSANVLRRSDTSMKRSDAIIAGAAANGSTAMSVANQNVTVQI